MGRKPRPPLAASQDRTGLLRERAFGVDVDRYAQLYATTNVSVFTTADGGRSHSYSNLAEMWSSLADLAVLDQIKV